MTHINPLLQTSFKYVRWSVFCITQTNTHTSQFAMVHTVRCSGKEDVCVCSQVMWLVVIFQFKIQLARSDGAAERLAAGDLSSSVEEGAGERTPQNRAPQCQASLYLDAQGSCGFSLKKY